MFFYPRLSVTRDLLSNSDELTESTPDSIRDFQCDSSKVLAQQTNNSAVAEATSTPKDSIKSLPNVKTFRHHMSYLLYFLFYVAFMTLGGLCFNRLEISAEMEQRIRSYAAHVAFLKSYPCVPQDVLQQYLLRVIMAAKKGILPMMPINLTQFDHIQVPPDWMLELKDIAHSEFFRQMTAATRPLIEADEEWLGSWNLDEAIFFGISVATTIGYGKVSPATPGGKLFCMAFACISIPITLIFSSLLVNMCMPSMRWLRDKMTKAYCAAHQPNAGQPIPRVLPSTDTRSDLVKSLSDSFVINRPENRSHTLVHFGTGRSVPEKTQHGVSNGVSTAAEPVGYNSDSSTTLDTKSSMEFGGSTKPKGPKATIIRASSHPAVNMSGHGKPSNNMLPYILSWARGKDRGAPNDFSVIQRRGSKRFFNCLTTSRPVDEELKDEPKSGSSSVSDVKQQHSTLTTRSVSGKSFINCVQFFLSKCGLVLNKQLSISDVHMDPVRKCIIRAHLLHFFFTSITIVLLIIVLPAILFHYVERGWSLLDAFYFCVISMTLVGLGDLVPDGIIYMHEHRYSLVAKRAYTILTSAYLLIGSTLVLLAMRVFEEVFEFDDKGRQRRFSRKFSVANFRESHLSGSPGLHTTNENANNPDTLTQGGMVQQRSCETDIIHV